MIEDWTLIVNDWAASDVEIKADSVVLAVGLMTFSPCLNWVLLFGEVHLT
jgi:hypothetical protein